MSHGLDVGLDALYDAAELDIASTFKDANAAVLAKYAADGVYYPARIVLLRESDVVVEFDDYAGDLHPTPFEDILPLVRANAVDQADDAQKRARVSDDDEDNDEDGDDGGDDDDSDQDFTEAVHKQRQQSEKFGAWETHTRGIGSILLAKMGYTPGSGLGKEGRGIVDPVPVAILPPGRGLGHVEEAKARKRQRKKQKRSDEGSQGGDGASGSRGSSDVFAFMNATLNSGKADSGPDNASDFVLQKSGRELAGDAMPRKPASQTSKTARLKALHVQEELERVRASLARARQGLERNRGDPRMRRTYEDQIDAFTLRISQLSSEDSRHSTALQRDKLRRSMTKF
ncbi:hypothetical protein BC831DRAFT_509540 [Entophlyctis helioformis]|nr:hypothetical protein BC831DRAFT_509540 [Entophlyctis helioformis]